MYRVGVAGNKCRAEPPQVGVVAPARKCTSRAAVLPGRCCAVVVTMLVLSYQPRAAKALSAKFSCKRIVPPPPPALPVIAAGPLRPSPVAGGCPRPAARPPPPPPPRTRLPP